MSTESPAIEVAGDPPPRRRALGRLVSLLIVAVAAAFLVVVFVGTVGDVSGRVLPSVGRIVACAVLLPVSVSTGALAWAVLVDAPGPRGPLVSGAIRAHLVKYAPGGGVFQVASQVRSASDAVPIRRAVVVFPVYALLSVCGAAVWAPLTLLDTTQPTWVAALLLLAPLGLASLHPRILSPLLRLAGRIVPSLRAHTELPRTAAILRALALSVVNIGAFSAAFGVLVGSGPSGILSSTGAFAAAWAVGYLAVPVPAGFGVREAVLIGLLPLDPAVLIAAAAVHRLVSICAEVCLAGLATALTRRRNHGAT